MHQLFKDKFQVLDLKITEVEAKVGCSKNYLSRFINGPQTLPRKWEVKIQAFIDGIEKELKALPVKNPDLLRPWIKIVEDYCKGAGIEPEFLVMEHKDLKKSAGTPKFVFPKAKEVAPAPTGNSFMDEQRKKKCGF